MKDYLDITQLVRSIQKADDQEPCFRNPSAEDCPETECEWRAYCLDEKSCRLKGNSERAGDCWSPPVTVLEKDELIRVEAEIPGLEVDDIQVRIHGNLMNLRGGKRRRKREAGENLQVEERTYGPFNKFLKLSSPVDARKVDAWQRNGLLHIVLPKTVKAPGKTVRVPVR